jgi:hypothetical protein
MPGTATEDRNGPYRFKKAEQRMVGGMMRTLWTDYKKWVLTHDVYVQLALTCVSSFMQAYDPGEFGCHTGSDGEVVSIPYLARIRF